MSKRKVQPLWTMDRKTPCSFDKIWAQVPREVFVTWKTSHKNLITKAFVGYLVRVYTFVDVCKMLKPIPGDLKLWREMRINIVQYSKTLLGVKLMLLRCQHNVLKNKKVNLELEIKENDLYPNDIALFLNLEKMGLTAALNKKIKQLPMKIPTARQTEAECYSCIKKNETFFGKFVSKKMWFIYKGNNLKHKDLYHDVILKVVEAFYFSTPHLTEEHRENTIKRAGHNQGIKLIKYYTAPERARTRQTENGFENVIQVIKDNQSEEADDVDSPYKDITFTDEVVNNKLSLRKYIRENRQNLPIIDLLSLTDDADFIKFAELNKGYIFSSTESVYEEIGSEKYYGLIANYLNVSVEKVTEVVLDLQNSLTA